MARTKTYTFTEAINEAIKKGLVEKREDVYLYLNLTKQTWSNIENYETQIKTDAFLKFCEKVGRAPHEMKIKNFNF